MRHKTGYGKFVRIIMVSVVTVMPSVCQAEGFLSKVWQMPVGPKKPLYLDTSKPIEQRVNDLVSCMTLEEKISQMANAAPAIERLGIERYDWWNECLHGVARAGVATVFPQAIGLAATWNVGLVYEVAVATSDEARAKYHNALRNDRHERFQGLTFWSPNINIFRDPRWGRGQETYGEDPYLTSRLGVAFVKGLQGDNPKYLKLVSTPKHYAVHSGLEKERHFFDARVTQKDLWETYLPAFEACIREGKAASVMCAYNRTNGQPCCASDVLLEEILRKKWGFDGYVVSDCGAIKDIHNDHKVASTAQQAGAMAVKAGCDLECGEYYQNLIMAVKEELVSQQQIDCAVKRLFTARFKLGMFDPPETVPYAKIPYKVVDCKKHRQLALKAARESIVLLKNEGGLLPLSKNFKRYALIGPNADGTDVLFGNYNGEPLHAVTVREGIRNKIADYATLDYRLGCPVDVNDRSRFQKAVNRVKRADVVIFVGGLSQELEAEGTDRLDVNLPAVQEELLKELHKVGKPVVLVLLNGSPASSLWAQQNIPAIVEAWYPGEEGGTAIAEVLFGDYNPSGRLPVTFPKSLEQVPDFRDYSMENRTYRYLKDEPLYPFGYGLSYTKFAYSDLKIDAGKGTPESEVTVSAKVKNVGQRSGDEVVQLYVSDLQASVRVPVRSLQGFKRIHLKLGRQETITFKLSPHQYAIIDEEGRKIVEPGEFEVSVGGCQPGYDHLIAETTGVLKGKFLVTGESRIIE